MKYAFLFIFRSEKIKSSRNNYCLTPQTLDLVTKLVLAKNNIRISVNVKKN